MFIRGKKILVMGIGVTGLSVLKTLKKYNNILSVYDEKPREEIIEKLNKNNLEDIEVIEHKSINMIEEMDFIVKSPGILPTNEFIQFAYDKEIPVISDIELAYNMGLKGTIIGITGTNGKTTSTMLAGEILNNYGVKTHIAGNMGTGLLKIIEEVQDEDYLVLELSSFQLEHINLFKPKVSLILNLTEDHLDWHGSFENYKESKFKIFSNQTSEEFLVVNWEDENLRNVQEKTRASIIWFSTKTKLPQGVFVKGNSIKYRYNEKEETVVLLEDIMMPGAHNIENICGVIGVMKALGVDNSTINATIKKFKGVEHRVEYVTSISGVDFYNDSKGTNEDATIKALEAFERPIILIAGGYNKEADYTKLLNVFKAKGKAIVLIGETAIAIKNKAEELGIENIYMAENLEKAVLISDSLANNEDIVLLSPACASWGMYNNFEERGNHFKKIVKQLTE